jgi:hypothetical protein
MIVSLITFLYFRVLDVTSNKQVARILTPNYSYNPYRPYRSQDELPDTYSIYWPKIFTTSEYVIIHAKLDNQKNKTVLEIYKLEEIRHAKVDICKPHKTIQVVGILVDK